MLAQALLGLERPAEAKPHLRRLTQLVPTDPAAWFNLGQTYEDLASAAVRRPPRARSGVRHSALALVAEVRLEEDRRAAAFHLYRQAVERAPTMRGLHAALAAIYRATGHPDWAAVEDEKERRLGPPDCARGRSNVRSRRENTAR